MCLPSAATSGVRPSPSTAAMGRCLSATIGGQTYTASETTPLAPLSGEACAGHASIQRLSAKSRGPFRGHLFLEI